MKFSTIAALVASVAAYTPYRRSTPALNVAKFDDRKIKSFSAPSGAALVYNNGPIVAAIEVIVVYWGGSSAVQFSGSQIEGFYSGITNSPWMSMMSQYTDSTGASVGAGSFVSSYSYDAGTIGDIQDSDVQSALQSLISSGALPQPTENSYYAVHFAPGVTITQQGAGSCVSGGFCAYHGTISGSPDILYGVLPDQGGGCAGGCGSDPSPFNNLCSVASHELGETVTDPQVGLNTLSWYDQTNGEIGDICNGQQSTTSGGDGNTYTIQLMFSNSASDCVAA